jgi:hypothetical protein
LVLLSQTAANPVGKGSFIAKLKAIEFTYSMHTHTNKQLRLHLMILQHPILQEASLKLFEVATPNFSHQLALSIKFLDSRHFLKEHCNERSANLNLIFKARQKA